MTRGTAKTGHRPDPEIFAEAREALDQRPQVPSTVRVHIDSGIATLTGSVRLPSERSEAETTVRGVPGVQRVINEIAVAQRPNPEGFEPPDERG